MMKEKRGVEGDRKNDEREERFGGRQKNDEREERCGRRQKK